MFKTNTIIIISFAIIIIVILVGFSTHYWTVYSQTISNPNDSKDHINGGTNSGLWKICDSLNSSEVCVKISEPISNSGLANAKGFAVIGIIFLILSFAILIFSPQARGFYTVLMMIGGICIIMSAGFWAGDDYLNTPFSSLGYSWYLELIGGIISVLVALYVKLRVKN